MDTNAGKLVSAGYALFSGPGFVSTVAVVFEPIAYRSLHALRLELDDAATHEGDE